ncbi:MULTISPECIES: ribbon-helix-helix domain-containing protein [Metallosphaera]|uniref:ribbon-helix-helix domain-containing protein n=1 Tax=Bacteria TaxID=2 RepID=UPI002989ACFD|nr:ribbon-helix-helix domain-containing protein [Metallosphaera sedula]MCP6729964.1 ribbon-helix-helix domain-containing protein [Metallosphaera sedula]
MPRKSIKKEYVTVSIPVELAKQIDQLIESGKGGYVSRQEFVADAIRRRIEELLKYECRETLPQSEVKK